MEQPLSIRVRFLLFPQGKEVILNLSPQDNWRDVKSKLIACWPQQITPPTSPEAVNFIYSGRRLKDEEAVSSELGHTKEPVTVHVVVKRNHASAASTTNTATPRNTTEHEQEVLSGELSDSFHFHGCFFNEEEVSKVRIIFDKKKGEDNRIAFSEIEQFLKVYWKWMERNKYHETAPFPDNLLLDIKSQLSLQDRATCEEFLHVFFLFDNPTPQEVCPHGYKERVHRATEELHKCMTEEAFNEEVFESVWKNISGNGNGALSCRELELFYFSYCVRLSKLVEVECSCSST